MLLEVGSPDYRGGAAHAMGQIGSKSALPFLVRAIEDLDSCVASLSPLQGGSSTPVPFRPKGGMTLSTPAMRASLSRVMIREGSTEPSSWRRNG